MTTYVYSCPDCDGDLVADDAPGLLYCPACTTLHAAAMFPDPDDERDRMIDDRDGAHA